ncbi:MAG: hypothetical protein AB1765_11615 [Candidatus Hydrogenedentota bacterium]
MRRLILSLITILFIVNTLYAKGTNKSTTKYFRELAKRDYVTLADACLALCLLLDGPKEKDFEFQLEFLKKKKILFKETPTDPKIRLAKGTVAVMLCKALKIKGGIMLRLFPDNQKYALKELVYLKLIGDDSINEWISGKELIGWLDKATEYRKEHYK